MAGVRLTGLASGMDTDAIVSQLMQVERQGRTRFTMREAAALARESALKEIQGKTTALRLATTALKSESTWGNVQSATSSDTTKLGVRLTGSAGPGGYSVNVTRLASADQHTYSPPTGPATLTIRNADGSARTSVEVADGATLEQVASAFNANADAGVIAVVAGGNLVLAAKDTGAAKRFSVDGLSELAGMAQQGEDAAFTVGSQSYTRPTNVVSDALAGVELTLKSTGSSAVNVTAPGVDQDAVVKQMKAYVDAYNALNDLTRTKLAEKRNPEATTSIEARKGALFGDSGLITMLSRLRGAAGTAEAGAIGLSTGGAAATSFSTEGVSGKLVLDEAKFREKLAADPAAARTAVEAFASAFSAELDPFAAGGGVMEGRVSASSSQLRTIKDQLARFDDRMAAKETAYIKQFSALEAALAKSQQMQSEMAARMGSFF